MKTYGLRLLYNLALPPLLLAALPSSYLKMRRRGGYGRDFGQRFGFYRREAKARLAALPKPWWIHAVSVGEVLVAAKLVQAARQLQPTLPLVLSTTTSTGRALAEKELPADVPVFYNPIDFPLCVTRALETVRPCRLVLIEAEVWPNLLHHAHAWGIPVALVNARLSPRSERRYRQWRAAVAPFFAQLNHVLVPDPEDVDRWTALGVQPEALTVTGSLKHDYAGLAADPRTAEFAQLLHGLWPATRDTRPSVLLAASTHPGEEAALAPVYQALRAEFPALKFLVAPRHFERAATVMTELERAGLKVARRSQLPAPGPAATDADTLLIDTTGELRAWQPLADAIVIGKSFLSTGGQNPVEGLMAGRPVLTGPHMENFGPLMARLLAHRAIIQVPSLSELTPAIADLWRHPETAHALTERARQALAPHQGAAQRAAQLLLQES